jgi:hypothetical protein
MVPLSGFRSPEMHSTVVVFPAPFGRQTGRAPVLLDVFAISIQLDLIPFGNPRN